jgi:hypothetical protein
MKYRLLAAGATVLTTTATAANTQGTTPGRVKPAETITPLFTQELPKVLGETAEQTVSLCATPPMLAPPWRGRTIAFDCPE